MLTNDDDDGGTTALPSCYCYYTILESHHNTCEADMAADEIKTYENTR